MGMGVDIAKGNSFELKIVIIVEVVGYVTTTKLKVPKTWKSDCSGLSVTSLE